MTVRLSEHFEGGSDGVAITTANTTFDTVSGSPTFSDVSPMEGLLGAETTAGTTYFRWNLTETDSYLGFEVRFDTMPGGIMYIGDCRAGSTRVANFRVDADGSVTIRSNFTAVDSTAAGVITVGDEVFFDWHVDWTGAVQELRIYVNGTLSDTLTGACNAAGTGITVTGVLESGSVSSLTYDKFEEGDTWLWVAAGDTTDPVAVVALDAKNAVYDDADVLQSCTFDVDASGSTDNVGVDTYAWADGGAGGSWSSTSAASPTWTPPDLTSGPWTLTCTVADAAANSDFDFVIVDVPATPGGGIAVLAGTLIASP